MFGENPMYMNGTIKVDSKGRFIVPADTGVEENDELALINLGNHYELENIKRVNKFFDSIDKRIEKATTSDELERLREYLYLESKKVLVKGAVDKQHRFLTKGALEKDTIYQVVGSKDSIFIIKKEKEL